MSKLENNKIRNLAELINIIDRSNKSGLLVTGLLYGDLFASVDKFDIRIVYNDKRVINNILSYCDLIQELFYIKGDVINKITVINDSYILHLKGVKQDD